MSFTYLPDEDLSRTSALQPRLVTRCQLHHCKAAVKSKEKAGRRGAERQYIIGLLFLSLFSLAAKVSTH